MIGNNWRIVGLGNNLIPSNKWNKFITEEDLFKTVASTPVVSKIHEEKDKEEDNKVVKRK